MANYPLIMNPPPFYAYTADPISIDGSDNQGFLGGASYQKSFGKFSQTKRSQPNAFSFTMRPLLPKSAFSSGIGNSKFNIALKTYTGKPTNNTYKTTVKRILEMMHQGYMSSDSSHTAEDSPFNDKYMNRLSNISDNVDPLITFLYDSDTTITETASTTMTKGSLDDLLNVWNPKLRELNYRTGGANISDDPGVILNNMKAADIFGLGSVNNALDSVGSVFNQESWSQSTSSAMSSFFNKNPILKDIAGSKLKGYTAHTPKIWESSTFAKKYNINITLTSPYGNFDSVAKHVLIPFAYIMALALPRQASTSTIDHPFLIQADSGSTFSIPLGMITNINIKKGGNTNDWTAGGFVKAITVQLEISDLYDILPVPYTLTDETSKEYGVSDISLRSYMNTIAGADLSDPTRILDSQGLGIDKTFGTDGASDDVEEIFATSRTVTDEEDEDDTLLSSAGKIFKSIVEA